jgi:hypothetical protein
MILAPEEPPDTNQLQRFTTDTHKGGSSGAKLFQLTLILQAGCSPGANERIYSDTMRDQVTNTHTNYKYWLPSNSVFPYIYFNLTLL